jgi:hypothetical protein
MQLKKLPGPIDELVEDLVQFLASGLGAPVVSKSTRPG